MKVNNGICRDRLDSRADRIMCWIPLLLLAGLLLPIVLLFIPLLFYLLPQKAFNNPPSQPDRVHSAWNVSRLFLRGPPLIR